MPVAKKAPARKTATRKSTPDTKTSPARRTPTKKAATPTASAKEATSKRTTAVKSETPAPTRRGPRFDKGPHGFVKGSDQAIIADLLIKGGAGRSDIVAKAKESIDSTNRNGNPKPIGTMVANVIRKLEGNGYVVTETIKAKKARPAS